jgi:hypothetical protein
MSHYNPSTGVLELTAKEANLWFKRKYDELPTGILSNEFRTMMHLYAALLKHHGHQVIDVQPDSLRVRATAEAVQAVLGRQTPDSVGQ